MSERPLTFFFHYHKAASRAAGKPQITIHFQKKCILVDNLVCNVPTYGSVNKSKQPNFVIKGKVKPSGFQIKDGIAYIN